MKKREFNKIRSTQNELSQETDLDTCQVACVHEETVATVQKNLPSAEMREELASFFRNFGDPTRLTIITSLLPGELCVCDIAAVAQMSVSAVSHQLRILRQAKIVRFRRAGKQVFYSIDDEHVGSMLTLAQTHLEEDRV